MVAIEQIDNAQAFARALIGAAQKDAPQASGPTGAFRKAAHKRLAQIALPGLKDEEWRFVRLKPLTDLAFVPAERVAGKVTADMVADYALPEAKGSCVVFVNGSFSAELSDISALKGQKGVEFGNFAQDNAPSAEFLGHLGQVSGYYDQDYFAALNSAGFVDGAFLKVDKDVSVDGVIQLLYLSTESSESYAVQPRNLFVMARGSKATVVEDYVGPHASVYFNNVVSEVSLDDSATFHHTRVQRDSPAAFHIARTLIHLGPNATYNSQNISLGARFSRYDVYASGDAEGIDCTLDGLAMLSDQQVSDTHTVMDHRKPHGDSHQLHKMIVDGAAHAVFNGKIFVEPQAQIIDAYQLNRTLLLSPRAKVNAKPQLEIFADDVKCTHGATIGQLDEDQLFYLKTRGLTHEEARDMLVYAFAAEVLELIPVESLRDNLEALVSRRTTYK